MKIEQNKAYEAYHCLGGETNFPFRFPIYDSDYLKVDRVLSNGTIQTLKILDDFIIEGVGSELGGTVILNNPALNGEKYNILLNVPEERQNDYTEGKSINANLLNKELDMFIQITQQLRRDVNNCVKAELGKTFDETLASIYNARDEAQQSEQNIRKAENNCNEIKQSFLSQATEQTQIATKQAQAAEQFAIASQNAMTSKLNKTMDNLPNGYDCIIEAWPTRADIEAGLADGSVWYEIYKSGKIKQGGRFTITSDGPVWIAFKKAFSTIPANVSTHPYNQPTNTSSDHNYLSLPLGITNTGFYFKYFDSDSSSGSSWRRGTVSWEAIGF